MAKYIDTEKLKAKVKELNLATKTYEEQVAFNNALAMVVEIIDSLQQEQPKFKVGDTIHKIGENTIFPMTIERIYDGYYDCVTEHHKSYINIKLQDNYELVEQEQPEVDLEKFTEKVKTFQGRYKYPEILSIKGAMAFMARMFYQYPNIARQWYDSLPKTTMD